MDEPKSKDQITKRIYLETIISIFGVPHKYAEVLAMRLFDQIQAHGGNPHNTEDIETTIRIVVGKWLQK